MDADRELYKSIALLEVEIRSFSNEGYKVKYDFRKNLISWRDNYMWNNNFMKSISDSKRDIINKRLPNCGMLEWMRGYNNGLAEKYGRKTSTPGEWEITVVFDDDTRLKAGARQNFPLRWNELKSIIEDTTECTFRLL